LIERRGWPRKVCKQNYLRQRRRRRSANKESAVEEKKKEPDIRNQNKFAADQVKEKIA
jgi:hypothetical protein